MITYPDLEIENLKHQKENLYYDKKSSRIKPTDIVRHIIGFANASGGVLAIGIEDNNELTGFNHNNSYEAGAYQMAILQGCIPIPHYSIEKKFYGTSEKDFILLIKIETSNNQVIRTRNEKVYLRSGDSTIELTHSQIISLEYDRGQRFFEEQVQPDSSINDIEESIINNYKTTMNVPDKSTFEILDSRGLIKQGKLTNAAIILFAKYPTKFLPSARIRFIRYDGNYAGVGTNLNIIKEKTFEGPLPSLISDISNMIKSQLREFQMLDTDGKFKIIPEYPEFAWFEGIINAVTHRDYSIAGDHIKVIMFDDRLEISSPGKLPNIVTLENMKNTRFSRNPRIARFLSEFGWVKELNEGVKRIYDEMQKFFLNEPEYTEPNNNSVKLVLKNSITSRILRANDKLSQSIFQNKWDDLSVNEQIIIHHVYRNTTITTKYASIIIRKSISHTSKLLKGLVSKNILEWHGSSTHDPSQYYTLNKNSD